MEEFLTLPLLSHGNPLMTNWLKLSELPLTLASGFVDIVSELLHLTDLANGIGGGY